VYRWQEVVFFKNEKASSAKLEVLAFVSIEPQSISSKNHTLTFQLPNESLRQVSWRLADLTTDCWKRRPLAKILKKMKIPQWRKSCLPVCEWQGELIFISYFGITENYHKLLSGSADLVTIEIFSQKIKL
jgi:hypothetical protein